MRKNASWAFPLELQLVRTPLTDRSATACHAALAPGSCTKGRPAWLPVLSVRRTDGGMYMSVPLPELALKTALITQRYETVQNFYSINLQAHTRNVVNKTYCELTVSITSVDRS